MTKPYSIVFSISTSTPYTFLTASDSPVLIKNVFIHNKSAGNATVHLTYQKNSTGISTNYDMWVTTLNAGDSSVMNDLIVINSYDSLACYDNSSNIDVVAHCVNLN